MEVLQPTVFDRMLKIAPNLSSTVFDGIIEYAQVAMFEGIVGALQIVAVVKGITLQIQ